MKRKCENNEISIIIIIIIIIMKMKERNEIMSIIMK